MRSPAAQELRERLEEAVRALGLPHERPLVGVCVGGAERACLPLMRLLRSGAVVLIVQQSGGLAAKLGQLVTAWRGALQGGKLLEEKKVADFMGATDRAAPARQLAALVEEIVLREHDAARRRPRPSRRRRAALAAPSVRRPPPAV